MSNRQWTDEFDKVIDELQVHMEQECDIYFEKIKYKVIEVYNYSYHVLFKYYWHRY